MNIQGIEINPSLRPDFWGCPHEDRPDEEIEQWWDVPFIRVDAWEDVRPDASYDDYCARIPERDRLTESCEAWEAEMERRRAYWFKNFPEGRRYWVMRLDGGSWDRPSEYDVCSTLDDAVNAAVELRGLTIYEALTQLAEKIKKKVNAKK